MRWHVPSAIEGLIGAIDDVLFGSGIRRRRQQFGCMQLTYTTPFSAITFEFVVDLAVAEYPVPPVMPIDITARHVQ